MAAVRKTFKEGASHIKIASHFSADEVAAAVDEAHLLGLKVTCDCETVYTAMAVRAGVDTIEHPLPRTDQTIAEMAKRKVTAVPTRQISAETEGSPKCEHAWRCSASLHSRRLVPRAVQAPAPTAGTIMLTGITEPVEVLRDRWVRRTSTPGPDVEDVVGDEDARRSNCACDIALC